MTGKFALQPGRVAELILIVAPLKTGILIGCLVCGQDTDPGLCASFRMPKVSFSGDLVTYF